MADVGKQYFLGEMSTVADSLLFTVSSVATAHLLHIRTLNAATTGITFTISRGADNSSSRLWKDYALTSAGTSSNVMDWAGFMVLSSAATLNGSASTTGVTLGVWGVEVTT